jgi:hypothetical protein
MILAATPSKVYTEDVQILYTSAKGYFQAVVSHGNVAALVHQKLPQQLEC